MVLFHQPVCTLLMLLNIIFLNVIICANTDDEKFVATNEWKVVKPGQRLPQGLHIRHDFTKKITEAKILDQSEKNEDGAIISVNEAVEESNFIDELDKNTKANENLNNEKKVKMFRSYEELKEQFGRINMTIKTDLELMQELFSRYKKLSSQKGFDNLEEFLFILTDLEYLTHQIDNGVQFIKLNGIKEIIFPSLQFEDDQLRNEALKLFSAVLQHNPRVQIHAFEVNSISVLVDVIFKAQSDQISVSALSALISLLRRFPTAQIAFIQSRGLSNMADYLNSNTDNKFELKVFSLVNDLIYDNIDYNTSRNEKNAEISKEIILYIKENFVIQGWCDRIKKSLNNESNLQNHSFIENIFSSIKITSEMCNEIYNEPGFKKKMFHVLSIYDNLSKIEEGENAKLVEITDTDLYFTHLRDNIKYIILNVLNISYVEDTWRDEL